MDLQQSFDQYIQRENLFSVKDRLIIAVSGGADSVVLCDICHRSGFSFVIAHVNFKLRGIESDGDEAFVRDLADHYKVEFFTASFDTKTLAADRKCGIQETARDIRYEWFSACSVSLQKKYDQPFYLLTAHHANDQVETLLMNFFKGTGIQGMLGMSAKTSFDFPAGRLQVRRPLLFAGKQDILAYASTHGLSYREDSSNLSDDYTRNYFRNQLIPGIRNVFPEVEQNLLDNIGRFQETNLLFLQSVDEHKKRLLEIKGETVRIPVKKLLKTPALKTILYEILNDFNATPGQLDEVIKLLQSESGKYLSTRTHRIFRNRDWLLITSLKEGLASDVLVTADDHAVIFPGGTIRVSSVTGMMPIDPDPMVALLDADKIEYPLLLRKWKQGDYFYPLGMQKKKKLSRFFIDRKLSIPDKEHVWVIESAKKIIWVLGMRIDDRCKVNPRTNKTLKLEWERASA